MLFCIPASTRTKNEARYRDFYTKMNQLCGIQSAYSHIHITSDSTAKHEGGSGNVFVSLDKNFFKNKFVLMMDDVVTTGHSLNRYKNLLEQIGARVIGAILIGKTI